MLKLHSLFYVIGLRNLCLTLLEQAAFGKYRLEHELVFTIFK